MNTLINRKNARFAGLIIAGLFVSTTLVAQDKINPRDLPNPGTNTASCQDVAWNRDMLNRYPWIVNSCQEVVMVDGKKWARFEAEFQGMNRDGTFDARFLDRRDRSVSTLALMPGAGQTVMLDSREYRFDALRDNQKLNFYVPEGMYGFAVTPGAPATELVQVVDKPAAVEQPEPAIAPVRTAQVDQRPATVLPATAGPLPLLALGGFMSLLGGLGLTIRRRNTMSNS